MEKKGALRPEKGGGQRASPDWGKKSIRMFRAERHSGVGCVCEYWSQLPCPPPGDLPDPGIEPRSPALQADSLSSEPQGKREESHKIVTKQY